MSSTKKGYFILADITGFTPFVAGTELEHSQLILSEILNLLVDKFTPQFYLAEIEGDAVFLYAPVEKFQRSEIIIEMVESAYFDFRDTKISFRRQVVCNCKACEMIPSLDLKFIIHSGDYVLNDVAGKAKPIGNAINILHRLTKNKVTESQGWRAYLLFTEECIKDIGLDFNDLHTQTEIYEHIGKINTFSLDLNELYEKFIHQRSDLITKENADYFIEREFEISVPELWEWVNNPVKRSRWLEVTDWSPIKRPFGRTGRGATNHCANSNFFESILDYRPFDYYTSGMKGGNLKFKLTGKFDKISNGTKFTWLIKMESKLPRIIKRIYSIFILKYGFKINKGFKKLDEFLIEE